METTIPKEVLDKLKDEFEEWALDDSPRRPDRLVTDIWHGKDAYGFDIEADTRAGWVDNDPYPRSLEVTEADILSVRAEHYYYDDDRTEEVDGSPVAAFLKRHWID